MNTVTESILNIIDNNEIKNILENLNEIISDYKINNAPIEELIDQYDADIYLIKSCIDAKLFEDIPYLFKTNILNNLKLAQDRINHFGSYGFDLQNENFKKLLSEAVEQLNKLSVNVENAKLKERLNGYTDYSQELKSILKHKIDFEKIIHEFHNIRELNKANSELYIEQKKQISSISKSLQNLEDLKTKIEALNNTIISISENTKQNNQEIENRKLNIEAFNSNIEEYKKTITKLENDAKAIIEKDNIIVKLIDDAKSALKLNTAYGISASFSQHHNEIKGDSKFNGWIIGSIIFFTCALALTVWIVSGLGIKEPNSINSIVGRIVAVLISISGATFCANQYVKQKNIIEDYAYKSVLAKSIEAFSSEIKNSDPSKVADYLNHVLAEIHKDPLRNRDKPMRRTTSNMVTEITKSVVDKMGNKSL